MANETLTLALHPREAAGSRTARRLRSSGQIPGVIYGLDAEPTPVSVEPSELRTVIVSGQALFDVALGDEKVPVLLKHTDRHPVRGNVTHVDFLRVDLNKPVESVVPIELGGVDEAPGVIARGVLDHQLREVTVSALPTQIPEVLVADISWMGLGDTYLLDRLETPEGVTIVADHADEISVVTITASRRSASAAAAAASADAGGEAAAEAEGATAEEASE